MIRTYIIDLFQLKCPILLIQNEKKSATEAENSISICRNAERRWTFTLELRSSTNGRKKILNDDGGLRYFVKGFNEHTDDGQ